MRYEAHFSARKLGAIGGFYSVRVAFECLTPPARARRCCAPSRAVGTMTAEEAEKMHYLVFAIVDEATEAAVRSVMEEHGEGKHWDWYRCGGRWDGYFQGEAEMKARETHGGFNFDDTNDSAARNCCKVADIGSHEPFAFVEGFYFVPREHYDEYEPNERGQYYGALVPTKDYEKRYRDALAKHPDGWVVVVDAHN